VRTLLVIPTYNEVNNVRALTHKLLVLPYQLDILFVDDSSPDGTADAVRELQAQHPQIHLLLRPPKSGIGSALQTGILWAYDHGYALCATMDADLTHAPVDLHRLLQGLGSNEVMLSSRFKAPGSLPGWVLWRRLLTHVGHLATRFLVGLPFDATSSLRVFNIARIPRRLFELPQERGYAFIFEVLLYLYVNGFAISEIPVVLPARSTGTSKITLKQILRSINTIIRLALVRTCLPDRLWVLSLDGASPQQHPVEWDRYWDVSTNYKRLVFSILAGFYRRWIIRPAFTKSMKRHFRPGAALLHAGCGSGQVDSLISHHFDITALDYSRRALELYRANNGQMSKVVDGSIFSLPFNNSSLDGLYNLGVLEHFTEEEIERIFREFHRVLRPDGKLLIWWPPEFGFSVILLNSLGKLRNFFGATDSDPTVPPEISRVKSKQWVEKLLSLSEFELVEYSFGPQDLFTQVLVVARPVINQPEQLLSQKEQLRA
jgi:glycosyltransferase involved in cell wall biosynthesis